MIMGLLDTLKNLFGGSKPEEQSNAAPQEAAPEAGQTEEAPAAPAPEENAPAEGEEQNNMQ